MEILKYKNYEGSAELDMDIGMCVGQILFIDDVVRYQAETPKGMQKRLRQLSMTTWKQALF
jgi:hypothetical protein